MKTRTKRVLWIACAGLALLGVIGGGLWLRARRQQTSNPAPGSGTVVTAFVGDLTTVASASGDLRASRQARLALGSAGQVERVYVHVGDHVEAGETLVQLKSDALQRAVQSAAENLAIQQAHLDELRKAPDQNDVAAARAAVADAQLQLEDLLAGPSREDVDQAQAALISAQAQLEDLLSGPSEERLAQAQTALANARAGVPAAEASTRALYEQVAVAQNDINNAQRIQQLAQKAYNQLVKDDWRAADSWGPYSLQGVAVKKAQINYDLAIANLNLARANANDSALAIAQAQIAEAEANLAALKEEKTAQVAAARAQVTRAERNLDLLTEQNTVEIAGTRARLAQTQAELSNLLSGAPTEQIAIAEVQVAHARTLLQEAETNLENATLVAPFGGLITDVYVTVGEEARGPALELIDTQNLRVVLNVDEVDIGRIEIGEDAVVTLEAWPDLRFTGTVVAIAPRAKELAGTITFPVSLSVLWDRSLDGDKLPVLTGMGATADLVTSSRSGVLMVPNQAIVADRETGAYYVNRLEGTAVQRVQVTIGSRDSRHTEIRSGLREGDRLWIGSIEQKGFLSQVLG